MAALKAGWQGVDELGVDSLWTWDHFFPPLYGAADDSHFEGWQILAAMAVRTSNVTQIGMLVTGCGYRADLLADMARTLDHLSNGRAVLGIGSGPVGRLPILIGGNGERRTLRLVAQYADMWNGYGDADMIRAKNDVIDRWCTEIGRDPAEIERTVWIDRARPDLMQSLADAGADHLILGLRAPYDLLEVERLVAARPGC